MPRDNSDDSKVESLVKILRQEQAAGFRDSSVIGRAGQLPPTGRGGAGPSSRADKVLRRPHTCPAREVDRRRPPQAGEDRHAWERRTSSQPPDGPGSQHVRGRQPLSLGDEVTRLKGVGSRNLSKLKKLGVERVRDLVYLFPHRHNDFTDIAKIAELQPGKDRTVVATVWESSERNTGPRRRASEAVLGDDTGNVRAFWFNNPYVAKSLRPGALVSLSGQVGVFRGQLSFQSPEYELLEGRDETTHTGRLVPVYPATGDLPQRTLRGLVKRALDACLSQIEEFLPDDLLHRTGLLGLLSAVEQMHYPDSEADRLAARRRLAFDELFLLQHAVLQRRRDWREEGEGVPLSDVEDVMDILAETLPFQLTTAQARVLGEILNDVGSDRPMARLLQGEVGSGKDRRGGGGPTARRRERPPGSADGSDRDTCRAALLHNHRSAIRPACGFPQQPPGIAGGGERPPKGDGRPAPGEHDEAAQGRYARTGLRGRRRRADRDPCDHPVVGPVFRLSPSWSLTSSTGSA